MKCQGRPETAHAPFRGTFRTLAEERTRASGRGDELEEGEDLVVDRQGFGCLGVHLDALHFAGSS